VRYFFQVILFALNVTHQLWVNKGDDMENLIKSKTLEILIPGNPIALRRPRFTKYGHAYDSQKNEKKVVRMLIKQQIDRFYDAETAVLMDILFCLKRPKSHYGTGKNSDIIKQSAPKYHIVKPDVDNLAKFYLDCMTGVVFYDDSQIVELIAKKQYAENPSVRINLISMCGVY
jgi:Holliday junction resolvase RusA-like endonuclease